MTLARFRSYSDAEIRHRLHHRAHSDEWEIVARRALNTAERLLSERDRARRIGGELLDKISRLCGIMGVKP